MHQAISAFTRDSAPCATPDDVAATLAYAAERAAYWERDDIGRYSRWLTLNFEFNGDELSDIAARRIMDRPAIVWG